MMLTEERMGSVRKATYYGLFAAALLVCVWFIVIASTRFVAALPDIGRAVASPFLAFVHSPESNSAAAELAGDTGAGVSATPVESATSAVPANTAAATPTQAGAPTAAPTPAHLSVTILSITTTGADFRIVNTGGTASRAGWTFSAHVPAGNQTYHSPAQPSLAPGTGYTYTLNWAPLAHQGTAGAFSVSVNE